MALSYLTDSIANVDLGGPGGPLLAAGIEVNCPVVAFVNDPPLMPLVPSPIPLSLPHSSDAP
jgi:hypothetical protein